MDEGEIILAQHAFGFWAYYGGALWESDAAQYNMVNIIEAMQMVRRRRALRRETIVNGYFCSN